MASSPLPDQAGELGFAAILKALKSGAISHAEAKVRLEALRNRNSASAPSGTQAIAVIGMACQGPGATTPDEYWDVLCGARPVSADRRLDPQDAFDPLFFRIAPREAEAMSPHQRLVLQEAWKALEDAAIRPRQLDGTQTAVFVGAEPAAGAGASFTGSSDAIIASRLSYLLNLRGPSLVVNTGCSSSATALHLACEALRNRAVSLALAGGVFANLITDIAAALTDIGMVSPSGRCLAFDAAADGTALCEGVGMVVLKRLEDALAAGDPIHGVILASGANQDGASNGITAPNGLAQSELFIDIYRRFAIDPARISYVEAHGTGTALGDPVEANALTRAFAAFTDQRHFCRVGSAKAAIGHASAAAGVLGLIKILLCLRHGQLPGMPHFKSLNPLIDFSQSALVIESEAAAWPAVAGMPRLAALSAFGHSGTNVHAVVAGPEMISAGQREQTTPDFVAVPVSARTPGRLAAALRRLQAMLVPGANGAGAVEALRDILAAIIGVSRDAVDANEDLDDMGVRPEQRLLLASEIEVRWGSRTAALTANTLRDIAANLPQDGRAPSLTDLAFTLQHGRDPREARSVFLVRDVAQLRAAIADALANGDSPGSRFPADAPEQLTRCAERWLAGEDVSWPAASAGRRAHLPLSTYVAIAPDGPAAAPVPVDPIPPNEEPQPQAALLSNMQFGPILFAPVWEAQPAVPPQREALPPRVVIAEASDPRALELAAMWPSAVLSAPAEVSASMLPVGSHICWLAPLRRPQSPSDDPPALALLALMRRLLAEGAADKRLEWTFVVTGGLATHRDEPVDPHQAALHGLIGVLAKEVGAWTYRVADVPAGLVLGAGTLSRLLSLPAEARGRPWAGRGVVEEGSAQSTRLQWLRQKLVPVELAQDMPQPYRNGGVYIVVGGAGDIGRVWTAHAVRVAGAQVVWVGRRPEDDTIRDNIRAIAKLGPAPVYFAADAMDAAAMARVRDAVKARFGAIHGVIHSALDFFEQDVAGLDDHRFLKGFLAKAASAEALAQVFADEPLDIVVMFSSVVAQIRNPRQAAYAAGCAYKDALAHEMNRRWRCPVKTINWGYWSSTKQEAADESALRAFLRLAEIGIGLIEPAEGMRALDALLTSPVQQMGLVKTTRPIEIEGVDATSRLHLPALAGIYAQQDYLAVVPAMPHVDVAALRKACEIPGLDPQLMALLAQQLDCAGVFSANPPRPAGPLSLWLAESLRLLAASGLAVQGKGTWQRSAGSSRIDAWQGWQDARQAWDADPAKQAQLDLVEEALRELPAVLRGERLATDALFPKGSMALVENVHRHNPVADQFHLAMAAVAVAAMQRKCGAGDGIFRILEIGAGTGGTTAHVLQALRKAGDRGVGEYCYTDLSQAFLHHGAASFGADRPFMRFSLLDIGRSPQEQGFPAASFDLVIAGNVLHATPDIRTTLRHAKSLLRPGGLLLACEVSQNALFTHLTFGLLEGWWLSEDPDIRIAGCPGLTPEGWRYALAQEGFARTVFPASDMHPLGQQIIMASSDGVIRSAAAPAGAVLHDFETEQAILPSPESEAPEPEMTQPDAAIDTAALHRPDVLNYFRGAVARALKMPPAEIDPTAALDRYGMDSILAVTLADELNKHFTGVSSTLVFEHRTVAEIADHFMATQGDSVARVVPRPAVTPTAPARKQAQPAASVLRKAPAPAATPVTIPAPSPAGRDDRIAVIGMSGRFPGAASVDALWDLIANARSAITDMPEERWSAEQMKLFEGEAGTFHVRGGYMAGIDLFDPQFFGISKSEAQWIDPRQRVFLQEAWHAFEDAGLLGKGLRGSDCGVFVGVEEGEYGFLTKGRGQIGSNQIATLAARIAYSLDLRGPNFALSAACASGLLAVHQACQALRTGECRVALAGGVSLILSPVVHLGLAHGKMLSADGACRVFDAGASGMVPADGVAALVLKRLEDAVRDGDQIHGVIRASAVNYNGKTLGMATPNPRSQAALVEGLYAKAGIAPGDIQLVLAHSVGSALTDAVEVEALSQAYSRLSGAGEAKQGSCVLASIKPLIGHSFAASGVVNLIAMMLAMRAGTMPGTHNFETLHPRVGLAGTPFSVATAAQPWVRPDGGRRRGAVGASGLSGTNVHMVIEEYLEPADLPADGPGSEVFVFSATSEERLAAVISELRAALPRIKGTGLAGIAAALQLGRAALGCRAAFVASTRAQLEQRLEQAAAAVRSDALVDDGWLHRGAPGRAPGAIAALLGGSAGEAFIEALIAENSYDRIAALWVQGVDIGWAQLRGGEASRLATLPGYPFAPERYWIPEQQVAEVQPGPASSAQVAPHADSPPVSSAVSGTEPSVGTDAAGLIRNFLARHLGLEPRDIADHVDWHDYGVDSILETRLMTMLEEQAGLALSGRELADHPTVGGLARHLRARVKPQPAGDWPLSEGQKGLWMLQRLYPDSTAYNVPLAFRVRSNWDREVFHAALSAVCERYPILCSELSESAGEAIMRPLPPSAIKVAVLPQPRGDDALMAEMRSAVRRPFDLRRGPLLRASIWPGPDEHDAVLIVFHHLVIDGLSAVVVLEALWTAYGALMQGQAVAWPSAPADTAAFVAWEREMLAGPQGAAHRAFWKAQWAGPSPALAGDRPPAASPGAGHTLQLTIPSALSDGLRAVCRARSLRESALYLALWQAIVARLARSSDPVIGMTVQVRPQARFENSVGYFVNTLPLRLSIDPASRFLEHALALQNTMIDAMDHAAFPFPVMMRECLEGNARDAASSYVTSTFSFQNLVPAHLRAAARADSRLPVVVAIDEITQEGEGGLALEVVTDGSAVTFNLKYTDDQWTAETVASLSRALLGMAQAVLAHPDSSWQEVRPSAPPHGWQVGPRLEPADHAFDVMRVIASACRASPGKVAVEMADDPDSRMSYAELLANVERLAQRLRNRGVDGTAPVAVCMRRQPACVVALLALLDCGAAYVPLSPDNPPERLRAVLAEAGARLVITCRQVADKLTSLAIPALEVMAHDIEPADTTHLHVAPGRPAPDPEAAAYILFTSGSTGTPKGVVVPRRALSAQIAKMMRFLGCSQEDHVLQFTPLNLDPSLEQSLVCLCSGGSLVMRGDELWTAQSFWSIVRRRSVTIVDVTPSYLRELLVAAPDTAPPSLRLLLSGGESLSLDLLRRWRESALGGVAIVNAYGPTETTVTSAAFMIGPHDPVPVALRSVPIGRPLAGEVICILDEAGYPVPEGVPGEIHIGGSGVAHGYLSRPVLTAERFVVPPQHLRAVAGGEAWFRTGDLGRYIPGTDGLIECLGRIDRQVKVRGVRIELDDVLAAILSGPGVSRAEVRLQSDTADQALLTAEVTFVAGTEPAAALAGLREHLGQVLPPAMIPARISAAGTVVDPARRVSDGSSGSVLSRVLSLWRRLLDVPEAGAEDNFFQLGGHSLLALRLLHLVEEEFGCQLALSGFLAQPTPAGLCRLIDSATADAPAAFFIAPEDAALDVREALRNCADWPFQNLNGGTSDDGASVEEMARRLVAEILAIRPAGPYRLAGWSFGGILAFETARQLSRLGHEIRDLVLIESYAPGVVASGAGADGQGFGRSLFAALGASWPDELDDGDLASVLTGARAAGLLHSTAEEQLIARSQRIYARQTRALRAYRPESYGGAMTLIRARDEMARRASADPQAGWGPLAAGGLTVLTSGGDHHSILRPPFLADVARLL